MKFRSLLPVLSVPAAVLVAFLANFALPHRVVHGLEAFAAAWSVYLVARLTLRLAARERELEEAAAERSRVERLAAVTTLAAGAAHELATPLGTIAVIAADLAHRPETAEDGALLRAEIGRCRDILDRLANRPHEDDIASERVSPTMFFDAVRSMLPARVRDRVDLFVEDGAEHLTVPLRSVATAVAGLVKNGVDASKAEGRVRLSFGVDASAAQIVVEDAGSGMSPEVAARLGEPFFTTKAPGAGLGLGVFLARLTAERLGGGLVVDSAIGRGTRVMLDLPHRVART